MLRLISNPRSSCLRLPSPGITSVRHHARPLFYFNCFYWCIIVSHHNGNQVDSNIHARSTWCPLPPLPQYRVLRLTLVYSHVQIWSMVEIPLASFILPVPLPLDQFLDFTEASPLLFGGPFVSSLIPSLRILEKTCDPSLSVIG